MAADKSRGRFVSDTWVASSVCQTILWLSGCRTGSLGVLLVAQRMYLQEVHVQRCGLKLRQVIGQQTRARAFCCSWEDDVHHLYS